MSGDNPAGQTGAGLGMAAGVGLMVPSMLSGAFSPDEKNLKTEKIPTVTCPDCGIDTPQNSRFCYKCGHQMVSANRCADCGTDLAIDSSFCHACGKKLGQKVDCGKCGAKLPPGSKFCTDCGEETK